MRKLIVALVALSAAMAGLTGCRKTIVVETANMVIHPGAHKGDVLVFETPGGTEGTPAFVHFPFGSPCSEGSTIPVAPDKRARCTVIKDIDVQVSNPAHYPFYIDTNDGTAAASDRSKRKVASLASSLKCPQCCPACQIIITNPPGGKTTQGGEGGQIGITETGSSGAVVEVLIDSDKDNLPAAADATAIEGQQVPPQVTWIRSGASSIGWSVKFDDATVCKEPQPITQQKGPVVYCTVITCKTGTYTYAITLDGTTVGKDVNKLNVFVPQPCPATPAPQ